MSSFTDPLELTYLDGRTWCVFAEFDFASEVLERIIRVPKGCTINFASTPRLFWNIYPPTGRYGKAAAVHDFLYGTPGLATRLDADRVFLEAMEALGVDWFTRHLFYVAVRAGGASSYKGGL